MRERRRQKANVKKCTYAIALSRERNDLGINGTSGSLKELNVVPKEKFTVPRRRLSLSLLKTVGLASHPFDVEDGEARIISN